VAPNSVAKFYLRSFCDKDVSGFALSTNVGIDHFANLNNANNRDFTDYAESLVGQDYSPSVFNIDFGFARTFDTIFLNSNFAMFDVVWSDDGTNYYDFSPAIRYGGYIGGGALNTEALLKVFLSTAVTHRYIQISALIAFGTNQKKRLTEISVTKSIGEIPISSMDTAEQLYSRISTTNLKGGSIQLIFYPNMPKAHFSLNFKNFTDLYTTLDLIKSNFLIDACLVYMYYSDSVAQLGNAALYLMNDVSDKSFHPSDVTLNAGVDNKMELLEV
jgi:hypothetical protein